MVVKGIATLSFETVIHIRTEWEGKLGHSLAPGFKHMPFFLLVLELNPGLPVLAAWVFIAWLPLFILLLGFNWKKELKQKLWRRTTFGGDK